MFSIWSHTCLSTDGLEDFVWSISLFKIAWELIQRKVFPVMSIVMLIVVLGVSKCLTVFRILRKGSKFSGVLLTMSFAFQCECSQCFERFTYTG